MKKAFSRKNKDFRVFIFTVVNSAIAFALTQLALPEYVAYAGFLIPFLNIFSKYINTKFFNDMGVLKEQI